MAILSAAECAAYKKQGYIVPTAPLLSEQDFTDLQCYHESIATEWKEIYNGRPEEMDKPHFLFPELFRWALHDTVLDMVEQLIGPNIVLFTTHFITKPAGTGRRIPWHEDSAYWAGMLDRMDSVCTVWLALDPSLKENGCLQVIPGSHLLADHNYHLVKDDAVFAEEIDAGSFDKDSAVAFELDPNHCSIHDGRIIHGSNPNTSMIRRCGLTLRYFSADCHFTQHENDPDFRIYLARGEDQAGNTYAQPYEINNSWREKLIGQAVGHEQ